MVIGGQTNGTAQLAATASTRETPLSLLKMTAAPDELPEPPRHCLEDMLLVAPAVE